MIPENIDSYLPIANTLPENHIFERYQHKQPSVTTLSTIVDPSFSQPYTYSPDNPIELPPKVYKPQSLKNKTTETQKNYISGDDSHKDAQSRSPKYSYAYSVNGWSYGPIFTKHEDSDGHLTKVSNAILLIDILDYMLLGRIQCRTTRWSSSKSYLHSVRRGWFLCECQILREGKTSNTEHRHCQDLPQPLTRQSNYSNSRIC